MTPPTVEPFRPIPNSLRPPTDRDDRPTIYLCFRTWEPILKWAARMDGCPTWAFSKHRGMAIERAIIVADGLRFDDREAIREIKAHCRIKIFEVRPPRTRADQGGR